MKESHMQTDVPTGLGAKAKLADTDMYSDMRENESLNSHCPA